nr:plasmid stability protein [Sinorhizobium meliloti]
MASMTIRNLDDGLKKRLRIRAAAHGRSMEDEARDILRAALSTGENRPANLAAAIRSRIVPLGGVELELPPPRGHARPTGFLRVIILDTNVLSELLAPAPSVAVETWLAEQQTAAVFTTTVTGS